MHTLFEFIHSQPIVSAILTLSVVIVAGLLVGSIRVRGINLGSAGVLFAGIVVAHFGIRIDHEILDFVKEFGLVLFVFMIGLQLGPGFFASLRAHGLRLNAIAASVVVLGTVIAVVVPAVWGISQPGAVGVLSGATTNTPSLGAAQQIAASIPGAPEDAATRIAMGYAVAYPVGIIGIILSLALIRIVFRIDAPGEARAIEAQSVEARAALERRTLVVENRNLDGIAIARLPHMADFGVQVSRHRAAGAPEVRVASGDTVLHLGDHLVAVGSREELDQFQRLIGSRAQEDLTGMPSDAVSRRVIITRKSVVGRTLTELHLGQRFGVRVTRLIRTGVEMAAYGSMRVQFGDVLNLVGEEAALTRVSDALGNAPKALDETQFMPIFLGIALGAVVGVIPIAIPGLPEPVRLGLAGGPLLVAIILARIGQIGSVVWYVPSSARLAFRELGITMFLACVGLKAGEQFFQTVLTEEGVIWLGLAAAIALIPPVVVGVIARAALKLNYATLAGVLAGSTTDPPALAFASGACRSDAPYLAYATVYPLTMVLRIVLVQVVMLVMW